MRVSLVAAAVVLVLAPACKKQRGPAPSVVIERAEQYRANICTCTDPVCTHHVAETLMRWDQATEEREGKIDMDTWSNEDVTTYRGIMKQASECFDKAGKN